MAVITTSDTELQERAFGGEADDTLRGGTGLDRCVGGEGADTFFSCEFQLQ